MWGQPSKVNAFLTFPASGKKCAAQQKPRNRRESLALRRESPLAGYPDIIFHRFPEIARTRKDVPPTKSGEQHGTFHRVTRLNTSGPMRKVLRVGISFSSGSRAFRLLVNLQARN